MHSTHFGIVTVAFGEWKAGASTSNGLELFSGVASDFTAAIYICMDVSSVYTAKARAYVFYLLHSTLDKRLNTVHKIDALHDHLQKCIIPEQTNTKTDDDDDNERQTH